MGDETTFEDAVDEYYDRKVTAEGTERTLDVFNVALREDVDNLLLGVEDEDRTDRCLEFLVEDAESREAVAGALGLSPGESCTRLEGRTLDAFVNYEQGVAEVDGVRARLVDPYRVECTDAERFDRLRALDRVPQADSEIPAHEVELSASAKGVNRPQRLVVSAKLPHGYPRWTLSLPDLDRVGSSSLDHFVDAVGAGGPENLDGLRVRVAPTDALDDSILSRDDCLTSGGGEYAIVPEGAEEVESDEENGVDGQTRESFPRGVGYVLLASTLVSMCVGFIAQLDVLLVVGLLLFGLFVLVPSLLEG